MKSKVASVARPASALLLISVLLLGGAYPAFITGFSQAALHWRAEGSLIERGGKIVGSALIAQPFTEPKYFWGRPSATTPPYNAEASAASNLNPGNPDLKKQVEERVQALKAADPDNTKPIPMDLVTTSASGLDPHISLAAAEWQLPRVARARGMNEKELGKLLAANTESPQMGFLGPHRVNVLKLNLALDSK